MVAAPTSVPLPLPYLHAKALDVHTVQYTFSWFGTSGLTHVISPTYAFPLCSPSVYCVLQMLNTLWTTLAMFFVFIVGRCSTILKTCQHLTNWAGASLKAVLMRRVASSWSPEEIGMCQNKEVTNNLRHRITPKYVVYHG